MIATSHRAIMMCAFARVTWQVVETPGHLQTQRRGQQGDGDAWPCRYRAGGQPRAIDGVSNPGFPNLSGGNCDVSAWDVLSPSV